MSDSSGNGRDGQARKPEPFMARAVDVSDGARAQVGRLVLVGKAASEDASADAVLRAALRELKRRDVRLNYLTTPAGFIKAKSTERWDRPISWETTAGDFKRAEAVATRAMTDVLRTATRPGNRQPVRWLVVGVDVTFPKQRSLAPLVQTALVVDLSSGDVVSATGKSYPASGKEETRIIRNALARNHVAAGVPLGVMVCHDLMAFGAVRQEAVGDRRGARNGVRTAIRKGQPTTILHLAHTTNNSATWSRAWKNLRGELAEPDPTWATAFAYRTKDRRRPRDKSGKVIPLRRPLLRRTAHPSVVTIIVHDPDARSLIDLG